MRLAFWEKGEGNIIEHIAFGFEVSIIKDETDDTYTVSILQPKKRIWQEKGFRNYQVAKKFAQEWVNKELGVKDEK